MRRRLLLAKAMVHNPAVLVLDETTAGVDIELRAMLWDYVRELNAQGVTIILTTHYLEEAEQMCGRIAVVSHGEVIACDDTSALLSRLDRKTLVIQTGSPLREAPAFSGGAQARLRPDGALEISYRRTETNAGALIVQAQAAGIEILDIATEEPHLEEVFVSLVRGEV